MHRESTPFPAAAIPADPSLRALAGEVRNLARRASAAADLLEGQPATAWDSAGTLKIAETLARAARLLGGLAPIRD